MCPFFSNCLLQVCANMTLKYTNKKASGFRIDPATIPPLAAPVTEFRDISVPLSFSPLTPLFFTAATPHLQSHYSPSSRLTGESCSFLLIYSSKQRKESSGDSQYHPSSGLSLSVFSLSWLLGYSLVVGVVVSCRTKAE